MYSQIPTSGDGDFTVTRNTAARRVNSAGLIESVASGIPRLDYYTSGGVTGCPALLVEPSAQNTCLQSQTFQNWAFTNASASSGNAAISPSNTQTAGLFIPNSGTTGRGEVACGTLSNATTYSFSCFIKTPTNSLTSVWLYISDGGTGTGANRWGVEINLSNFTLTDYIVGNGSVTSKAVENYGNGWYRIRVTGQVTSAISGSSVAVVRKVNAGADTNGINGVLVWGAQLETGSVATSYIPTTTGTGSRSADVISVSGAVSGSIGQTEGTIYIECQSEFATNDIIVINTAGQSPGINYLSITKTNLNRFQVGVLASGTSVSFTETSGITSFAKIALAYASGNTACFINGIQVGTTSATGFSFNGALNNIRFVANLVAGANMTRIRAVALYTDRLTNAELATLTTP
jgi:hypothetical protein